MTQFQFGASLLRVHPLDAPVVALAARIEERGADRAVLAAVGAVKFHGDRVLGAFHADDEQAVARLPDFIGGAPLAAHGLSGALAQAGLDAALGAGLWDARELAGLLIPASADDALPQLTARLGLEWPSSGDAARRGLERPTPGDAARRGLEWPTPGDAARLGLEQPPSGDAALPGAADASDVVADAHAVRAVHLALVERARALPAGALRRLADLLRRARSPLADLIAALADAPSALGAGPIGALDEAAIASRLERPRSLGTPNPPKPFASGEVGALLADGGPFARRFPRYEPRAEQAAMAEAVARALGAAIGDDGPRHLLVEGGTGIGKSVAYLLPAVLFALRNNARVVISTNTINLQEQLVAKDIPDLLNALREEPGLDVSRFRCAQLKGKANYLCIRRWEARANDDATSPDEARLLAKTLVWLDETRTGDRADLRLDAPEAASWERMSASGFSACAGAREGACFYRHAREEAAAAHLLVINHALLLSDLQVGGSLLPDYDFLIVDEAHNLETEATRQFGFRISHATVEDLVERLGGVIHGFGQAARASAMEQARKESAALRCDEAQAPLYRVRDDWARLMAGLAEFAAAQRGESDDGELRITSAERVQPAWSALDVTWADFERSIAEAAERAAALFREMESLPAGAALALEQLKGDLTEWLADQGEAREKARAFVSQPDDQTVYWIGRGANLSLNGAPLDVAPRLREELFDAKQAVVLTSATLTVGGGFAHVRDRLGVEEPEEVALGSPFDYRKAALLCIPTDAPEPGNPRYAEAVAGMLDEIARMSDGRVMALFTSHAALRAAAARLRKTLPGRGVGVLAQGPDGAPQQLLTRFRRNPRAILLGTASFWEGVDVGNAALKTLVLARLPFNVPTEPIFAARSAQYEREAFMRYAVPQAVLRFRQGFGRLIRGKGDRGVVVALDSRIASKAYGRVFLESIPPATTMRAPFREIAPAIRRWHADDGEESGG